jgi:hypothetical protein
VAEVVYGLLAVVAASVGAAVRAGRLGLEPASHGGGTAHGAIERPAEVHLHFHGVSAEDIAAILRHRDQLR